MNNKVKVVSDIKKYIRECIKDGKKDIQYWNRGKNLYAENVADSIAERNEKLKKLLGVKSISKDMIINLIKTETDDSLVLIYENILDF